MKILILLENTLFDGWDIKHWDGLDLCGTKRWADYLTQKWVGAKANLGPIVRLLIGLRPISRISEQKSRIFSYFFVDQTLWFFEVKTQIFSSSNLWQV